MCEGSTAHKRIKEVFFLCGISTINTKKEAAIKGKV